MELASDAPLIKYLRGRRSGLKKLCAQNYINRRFFVKRPSLRRESCLFHFHAYKAASLLFLFAACFVLAMPARSSAAPEIAPDSPVKAASVIVLDVDRDQILYEQNADALIPPASLTKVISIFVALDSIEAGKADMNSMVPVSRHAAETGGSRMGLTAGETVSLSDLFLGMSVSSGNDASMAVAEFIGGSEQNFVDMMNAKAKSLGMYNTHFVNPNGLPAKGQFTTARDMMLLGRAYLHSHLEMLVYHNTHFLRHGQTLTWNKNPLLGNFEGADGIKTGWVNKSGYNIIATAERDGRRMLAVVLGAPDPLTRGQECCRLLDAGFLASASVSKVPYDSILLSTPADIYHPDWKLTAHEALATVRGGIGTPARQNLKIRKAKKRRMRTAAR